MIICSPQIVIVVCHIVFLTNFNFRLFDFQIIEKQKMKPFILENIGISPFNRICSWSVVSFFFFFTFSIWDLHLSQTKDSAGRNWAWHWFFLFCVHISLCENMVILCVYMMDDLSIHRQINQDTRNLFLPEYMRFVVPNHWMSSFIPIV